MTAPIAQEQQSRSSRRLSDIPGAMNQEWQPAAPRVPFANLPEELINNMLQLNASVQRRVEEPFRSLARLRASQINGCAYCIALHTGEARKANISSERLALLPVWRDAPVFSVAERLALAMVESLAPGAGAEEEHLTDAALMHFGPERFSELAFNVAQIHAWNALMRLIKNEPPAVKS